jgi:hypothetical protein
VLAVGTPCRYGRRVDGNRGYTDDPDPRWQPEERGYPDSGWDREPDRYGPTSRGRRASDGGEAGNRYAALADLNDSDQLPSRPASPGIGPRSGEPLFSPDEAARFHAAAQEAVRRPGGAPTAPSPLAQPPMPQPSPLAQQASLAHQNPLAPSQAGPQTAGHSAAQPGLGQMSMRGPAAATTAQQDAVSGDLPGPVGQGPARVNNVYRARRPAVAIGLIIGATAFGLLMVRALAIAAFGHPFLIGGVIASGLALGALPLLVLGLYGLVTGAAHAAEQYGFRLWARPPVAYLTVALVLLLAAAIAAG